MGKNLKSAKGLIFDIGAHRGDDTSVYLQLGYIVVSVEANPTLVTGMKKRFFEAIASGQLILLNYAIANEDNKEVLLYLVNDDSQSSLIKKGEYSIKVLSRTLGSLVDELGVPSFCKIDIEGSDHIALQSLTKRNCPPFISVEISGITLDQLSTEPQKLLVNLDLLAGLGYNKFKLVDQQRLAVLSGLSFYRSNLKFINRARNRIFKFFSMDARSRFLKSHKLEKNAEVSGYPGYLLKEEWVSYDEIKRRIEFHFHEYSTVTTSTDYIFWADLHAAI